LFTSDQQEVTESLPSFRVTSSEIAEMDNDSPAFDTMREEYVINNQLIKQFEQQNTQHGEYCDKDQEQNENSVDPGQNTVSSREAFDMYEKLNILP
jgi:hypothetical protein